MSLRWGEIIWEKGENNIGENNIGVKNNFVYSMFVKIYVVVCLWL